MSFLPAISACVVLGLFGACGGNERRPGWLRPFTEDEATALVKLCLPGAKRTADRPDGEVVWLLRDPGPDDGPTFRIDMRFGWENTARTKLGAMSVGAYGPSTESTPANGRRYRAAVSCAFGSDVVPADVRATLISLVETLDAPGRSEARREGFLITVSETSTMHEDFFASATVFGPVK